MGGYAGKRKLSYSTSHVIEDLHQKYFKCLWNYAAEIIKDVQCAEDLVADMFASFILQVEHFKADEIERHLYMIINIKCISYIIEQQHIAKSIVAFNNMLLSRESEIEAELTALIYDELTKLSPQRKKIMVQLYMKGLTSQQVARRMKLSRQTVLNQKGKALKALRNNVLRRFLS